ncbi:hypothetical protein [Noviherbaspirillum cavernae]|uniref:hypothetical protein n=1 Tax=Noviherbaspirillum cavernae TaxID=2320862 RepID=UPI001314523D|nr:hypothetical protein [Noviherbaspirillum cavernae]
MRSDTYFDEYSNDPASPAQAVTTACIASMDTALELEEGFPWSRVRRLSKKG